MTKAERKKLRKNLPAGFLNILAAQLGFTPQYISDVIRGTRTNRNVMEAAILLAEETANVEKELKAKLAAI